MTKKCVKCSKEYNDTCGVCLFCGSKLECCEDDSGESNKTNLSSLEFLAMTVIVAIIIVGIFFLIYFAGAKYWSDFQDSMYNRGRFPNIKLEKP